MTQEKKPIRWAGVFVSFALNILLVSLATMLTGTLSGRPAFDPRLAFLATLVAPILAGILTALYTGYRGGIHAFLGGILSAPILIFIIFQGVWQFGIFAGAFCTIGGVLTEMLTRRH